MTRMLDSLRQLHPGKAHVKTLSVRTLRERVSIQETSEDWGAVLPLLQRLDIPVLGTT